MKKILDLSVFEDLTLDVTLPDKTVLRLMKPTQKMVIAMLKFKDMNADSKPEDVAMALDKTVLDILNTNDAMKEFKPEDVEKLNIPMKLALIKAYTEFLTGIQSDPN